MQVPKKAAADLPRAWWQIPGMCSGPEDEVHIP